MTEQTIQTLRHILTARRDTSRRNRNLEAGFVYGTCLDLLEAALANDIETLREFDYFETDEECDPDELW